MSSQGITYLIEKCFNGTATVAEHKLLAELINKPENEMEARKAIRFLLDKEKELQDLPEVTALAIQEVILGVDKKQSLLRKLSKKAARWVAAAVLIIAVGSGVYYFSNQSSKLPANIGGTGGTGRTGDIAPGTNRAVLTINDKQNINLASDKTGINIDSTITYNDGEKIADAGQMLQLTTPRGGQYQAVLPDGSKVWLNAASSIKFPSTFDNKERRVEVTGEAYFEIAKDATKPFKVSGSGQEIEVLGTSFNINIYNDEPVKKTTLITGKIGISVGAPLVGAQNPAADAVRAPTRGAPTTILHPNEQLQITGTHSVKRIVQTDDVLAWKNGFFNFNKMPIKSVMRQLERWFDIEVKYEGDVSERKITGEIPRNVPLKDIIEGLQFLDVKLRVEGKILIVRP